MTDSAQRQILLALIGLLRPIAQVLMRSGISYKDFSNVAKKAFVDTATETYGVRGRPTNVSRVALLTGLTRKEVRFIKEFNLGEASIQRVNRSLPAEVLHRWHTAELYVDRATKSPLILPFSGAEPSFSTLVRECMRDIPPGAVRTELKRIGAIKETSNGFLQVLKRDAVPLDSNDKLIEGLEAGLAPLARTVAFNSDPSVMGSPRFQRAVSVPFVPVDQLASIEAEIASKLVSIAIELDDLLAEFESDLTSEKDWVGLGIGLYYYRDEK
jgi:hypothetical protein